MPLASWFCTGAKLLMGTNTGRLGRVPVLPLVCWLLHNDNDIDVHAGRFMTKAGRLGRVPVLPLAT